MHHNIVPLLAFGKMMMTFEAAASCLLFGLHYFTLHKCTSTPLLLTSLTGLALTMGRRKVKWQVDDDLLLSLFFYNKEHFPSFWLFSKNTISSSDTLNLNFRKCVTLLKLRILGGLDMSKWFKIIIKKSLKWFEFTFCVV